MADLYVWLTSFFFLIALLVLLVYQITRTTSAVQHIHQSLYFQQHKMEANPSSSSFSPAVKKHDVFLSFRGEDTRNNFTSHLSLALREIGLFSIFKDDIVLPKGKDIGSELMKAIEDSHYAVVVLSENYANSIWCLKELAKIVECMGDSGTIRPIFYHVNPSHVRNVNSSNAKKRKRNNFWEALDEHAKNPSNSEYLESWRNALVKVANLSGGLVNAQTDEAIFIKSFVAGISSELGASIRTIGGLFGMASRLSDLDSYVLQSALQSAGTNKACFIGIHGMGGIGKSTLAADYYTKMSHKFDGSSFLQNIREVCGKKVNGLVSLQKRLLKDTLEEDFKQIGNTHNGREMIKSRLRHKKVLIVLDDVSKSNQLDELAGAGDWFGSGSIILVTTRDGSFLNSERYTIYGLELLNPSESLQLFSSKAFGNIEPPENYRELSQRAVEYTRYLPLALKILGSLLRGKTISEWGSKLDALKKGSEKEIVEILKIGFDDLNEDVQSIFLDIACFFNGFEKDYVMQVLDSFGFQPIWGISHLVDKSLLSIKEEKYRGSTILMHDLLQEMGKEIVREKSDNELGRQSRIWDEDDLYHILENREETNKVEAIVTSLNGGKKYRFEALSFMKKLRLLKISEPYWFAGPDCFDCDGPEFSYNLQYLEWKGFPFSKLTSISNFCKLFQLKLSWSKLRQLCWKGIKPLCNLKVIDISYSRQFTKFEDFTVVPNLKKLILCSCSNLLEIHPSIKHLKMLIMLDLTNCTSLEKLPEEINGLASLQTLDLRGCTSLKRLTEEINGLASLQTLNFSDCTSLEKLPEEINALAFLQTLNFSGCTTLERLPEEINGLASLKALDLSGCTSLKRLAEEINGLASLQALDLSGCTSLERLAEKINGLASLQTLDLSGCTSLERLVEEINGLAFLQALDLSGCTSLERLAEKINGLASLQTLDLSGCQSLERLAEEINDLAFLQTLDFSDFTSLERLLGEINGQISLQTLDFFGCTSLERLVEEKNGLASLRTLDFSGFTSLERLLEEINGLASLQALYLSNYTSLERLPEEINSLASLQTLVLSGCTSLERLPEEINGLASLQIFHLKYCTSLERLADEINGLASLKTLHLIGCTSLKRLAEEINGLPSLQNLYLYSCTSLERLAEKINGLASLRNLHFYHCTSLERLPEEINGLTSLKTLHLTGCTSLKRLTEDINGLASLQNLHLSDCTSLERLPEEINGLASLQNLHLSGCTSLERLPEEINGLTSLQNLYLSGCTSLARLPVEINSLVSLQTLDLSGCTSLERLPEKINCLASLRTLVLHGCTRLERLLKEKNGLTSL